MDKTDIRSYLTAHPLFENLNPDYLNILLRDASNVQFNADEHIFLENEPAEHLYLIRRGRVAVEIDSRPQKPRLILQVIDADEILGWSWMLYPYKWHFNARALWQTSAVMLNGKYIREHCERETAFGYAMYKRLMPLVVQRLQMARVQLMNV